MSPSHSPFAPDHTSSYDQEFRTQVISLLEEGNYKGTLKLLRSKLRNVPNDLTLKNGIQLLECKLDKSSRSFDAAYDKAMTAYLSGERHLALEHLRCCKILQPKNQTIAWNIQRLEALLTDAKPQETEKPATETYRKPSSAYSISMPNRS